MGHPTISVNLKYCYYTLCGLCRCECFGHASTYRNVEGTGGQLGRCVCDCYPSTNTEGENVCGSALDIYGLETVVSVLFSNTRTCLLYNV